MKIVIIATSIVPAKSANSMQVMKMAEAFMLGNNEVILLLPEPSNSELFLKGVQDLRKHYGLGLDVQIKNFTKNKVFKGYDFDLKAALWAKKNKAAIVISRTLPAAFLASIFGVKTVFEAHYPVQGLFGSALFFLSQKIRKFKLSVISEKLKHLFMQKWNLKSDDLAVFHDGVDVKKFINTNPDFNVRNNFQNNKHPLLCYSGHLYDGRGVDIIIDIARTMEKLNFLIVGGNNSDIQRLKKTTEGLRNIYFAGFLPNEKIPQILKACDILLMPYQQKLNISTGSLNTSGWMSPLKMFEYMATEVPIISSDLPSLREVLNDDNSFFCRPDNVDDWKKMIRFITENKEDAKRKAKKAMQDVKSYDWKARCAGILSYLEDS